MKPAINRNDLPVSPLRNVADTELHRQYAIEKDLLTVRVPGLKEALRYPVKQPIENAGKRVKTKLIIKNMVSIRCKMIVKLVLENMGLYYNFVELGEAEIAGNLSEKKRNQLKTALLMFGLELVENKKDILVEKIKNVIVEMIHYEDELPKIKFSDYLSEKLNYDYTYLANLFSEVKGISIEHFMLSHKIERVKELLVYGELTIKEIAWKLHYSSVAHLSNQFKKITGLTPTHFKNMKHKRLIALENV
jgi:AraC-like DNA-binding protein